MEYYINKIKYSQQRKKVWNTVWNGLVMKQLDARG